MRFVDTNILLYAASKPPADVEKGIIALKLLDESELGLSVQVLQEFYAQATRPTRRDCLSHDQAVALIESWLRFPVQSMTLDILRAALESCQRFQISYWDAAIIEAARAMQCEEVLSEDLNAGQNYGGIRVVNPFLSRRRRSNGKR